MTRTEAQDARIAAVKNRAKDFAVELAYLREATDGIADRLRNEELAADKPKYADELRALNEAAISISNAKSAIETAIAFLTVALHEEIVESVDAAHGESALRRRRENPRKR